MRSREGGDIEAKGRRCREGEERCIVRSTQVIEQEVYSIYHLM